MKRLFFSIYFVLTCLILQAQDKIAPKYSNEFLQIGVGADALGRSNAVVASIEGVNAGYWNPAGLLTSSKFLEVGAMHSEYFAGIAKYDYLGLSKVIDRPGTMHDNAALGLSMIRFAVDDIPNTTQLIDNEGRIDYDRITTFTASDFALILSYANKNLPIEGLSGGVNFKIIRRKVGDFSKAWGFGIDAGIQYQKNENLRFGLMLRDVTSTFNAWIFDLDDEMREVFVKTGNELPQNGLELTLPRLIAGVQYKKELGTKGIYALGEIDLPFTFDGKRNTLIKSKAISIDPNIGVEIGFKTYFCVRIGVGNFQEIKEFDDSKKMTFQPNAGFGVSIKNFTVDYAFTDLGDNSIALYSHVISLKAKLNKPKNAKR
ncbi:MAG: hypothetical protein HYU67_07695 [Flavobacteriia bacterium]|nr:hypothetical protein [Flavobacteriia bacterium]